MSHEQQHAITHVVVLFYAVCFMLVGHVACGQCMLSIIVSIVMLIMIQLFKIGNSSELVDQFIFNYWMNGLKYSIVVVLDVFWMIFGCIGHLKDANVHNGIFFTKWHVCIPQVVTNCMRNDSNPFENHMVSILSIMYICSISMIATPILYFLSWIYGKYNFNLSSMFEIAMMINERIDGIFYSRLNLMWNGGIRNRLSHIQWALSLVLHVRRSDFYFSWNGQDCFLSCLTSTM